MFQHLLNILYYFVFPVVIPAVIIFFIRKEKKIVKKKKVEVIDDGYETPRDDYDPSYDARENQKRIDAIQKKYPERFEDFKTAWRCVNFKKCFSVMTQNDVHFNCTECDVHLCVDCYEIAHKNNTLHTHTSDKINFFAKQNSPRWDLKMQLYKIPTSVELLLRCFKAFSERYLFAEKQIDGKWKYLTFKHIEKLTKHLAAGMRELGLWPRDFVGICAEPRHEWAVVDFACIHQSLVTVPIQRTLEERDIQYIITHSELKAIVVSKLYLDKLLNILNNCKTLKMIIIMEDIPNELLENFRKKYKKKFFTFNFIVTIGSKAKEYIRRKAKPDDIMSIVYTSGTVGFPKGAVFTEKHWVSQMKFPMTLRNIVLYEYMPLSHIAGRVDIYTALFNGGRAMFTDNKLSKFFEDIQTINPTAFGPVPRICNLVYKKYQERVHKMSIKFPKKRLSTIKMEEQKKLKYVFGNRISSIKISSAPITNKVKRFLRKVLDVGVSEGYGSTEAGGISSNNRMVNPVKLLSLPELGYLTTDKPPRGEICVKNTRIKEYYKNEKENKKRFWKDDEGVIWFRTGDVGEMVQENEIKIIDRVSNVIKLSQGEFVSLEKIEAFYIKSKFVKQLLVYADSFKSYCVAIVIPNKDVILSQMKVGEVKYEDFKQILMEDFVRIEKLHSLRAYEKIVDFFVDLNIEWSAENKCITLSNKKIRKNIRKMYENNINQMYLSESIRSILKRRGGGNLEGEKSFADLGGDSLSAVALINELKEKSIKVSFDQLMNGKISDLSLKNVINAPTKKDSKKAMGVVVNFEEEMKTMLSLVKESLSKNEKEEKERVCKTIFLTGSSGFLGSHILSKILHEYPSDVIVFCLIRKSEKNLKFIVNKGYDKNKRVEVIFGDLGGEYFGMRKVDFYSLSERVDLVIHCGASVNHLLAYDDLYDVNVKSLFDVMRLVTYKRVKPLHFVSSISAYKRIHLVSKGYGSTKFVCDSLLLKIVKDFNLPITIYRPSLIIGDKISGEVNRSDWFNRLLKGIVDFKVLPVVKESIPMNCISVDYCAGVIVRLLKRKKSLNVYNICGKNRSFKEIFEFIKRIDDDYKVLPHSQWFDLLKKGVLSRKNHPLKPFLYSFSMNVNSMFVDYDVKGIELDLKNEKDIKFEKVNQEDVRKYLKFLK